jgi:hypothetical protein
VSLEERPGTVITTLVFVIAVRAATGEKRLKSNKENPES